MPSQVAGNAERGLSDERTCPYRWEARVERCCERLLRRLATPLRLVVVEARSCVRLDADHTQRAAILGFGTVRLDLRDRDRTADDAREDHPVPVVVVAVITGAQVLVPEANILEGLCAIAVAVAAPL